MSVSLLYKEIVEYGRENDYLKTVHTTQCGYC